MAWNSGSVFSGAPSAAGGTLAQPAQRTVAVPRFPVFHAVAYRPTCPARLPRTNSSRP